VKKSRVLRAASLLFGISIFAAAAKLVDQSINVDARHWEPATAALLVLAVALGVISGRREVLVVSVLPALIAIPLGYPNAPEEPLMTVAVFQLLLAPLYAAALGLGMLIRSKVGAWHKDRRARRPGPSDGTRVSR